MVLGRALRVGALVALGGGLRWRTVVNSTCWRTPWTEIAGNPLLTELLVPSVFHIRAVTLLDKALDEFIGAHGLTVPKKYLTRGQHLQLVGRISFLGDRGHLPNAPALHVIRERRNDLAHALVEIGWETFEADAIEMEKTLRQLGLDARADAVQALRKTSQHLQHPAHRKFYLGAGGMLADATIEFGAELVVAQALARALREPSSPTPLRTTPLTRYNGGHGKEQEGSR